MSYRYVEQPDGSMKQFIVYEEYEGMLGFWTCNKCGKKENQLPCWCVGQVYFKYKDEVKK